MHTLYAATKNLEEILGCNKWKRIENVYKSLIWQNGTQNVTLIKSLFYELWLIYAIMMHLLIAQPNKHSCLAYFSNSFFDISLKVREKKFLPCHAHSLILRLLCIYWFLILCNFGQDYYETVFARVLIIK